MPVHFYNPNALLWLWLVPAVAGLFVYSSIKRKQAVKAFGAGARFISRKREAVGYTTALALTILALSRPAWDVEQTRLQENGRDVIFLLDVSRSMLADDLHPNRLEHAKTAILDCVDHLSGDRVGLVLFAGSAEIRCPLTVDYDYFRMALRQASPDSVAAGGTMIAHAIERTLDKLIQAEKAGMQDLILITDGEDQAEAAEGITAVKKLEEAGVRFIAIGLGDRIRGRRIAVEDEETGARSFMKHGQTEVWTKLQSETLRRMAGAVTDGIYFDVATGPFDLARLYRQIMENAQQSSNDAQVMERYEEKFHLFTAGALIVLFASTRWKRKSLLLSLVLLTCLHPVYANPAKLFRAGNKALIEGRFEEAINAYHEATVEAPESAEVFYNLGNAQYRAGSYEEAAMSYAYAASLAQNHSMISRCIYNQGNCLVKTSEGIRQEDPDAAAAYCQQATRYYRMALDYDSTFTDAAYNLEIAQHLTAEIEQQIKDEQEKEKQENQLITYIREKLEEFIERQTRLQDDQVTGEPQLQLEKETRDLAKVIETSGLHEAIPMPDGTPIPGPLKDTYTHTVQAADAMRLPDQPTALAELIAALGAAPEDPNKSEDESEGDPEESDEYDMDYEESDEDADLYEEADPFGDFSEYEEIRGVPPPNQTEMDILAEEVRNQERRKEKKAGEYKSVEKDW